MSSGCGDVLSLQDLQVAKRNQIFEAEVITGKQGGVASGANIDYATNQNTGQVQKTMPAILRDIGFEPASFDFTSGGTLAADDRNKAVLWPMADGGDGDWYYWEGALPKVIPAASTPASTGGIADGAWRPVGDITLRGVFEGPNSDGLSNFYGGGGWTGDDAPFWNFYSNPAEPIVNAMRQRFSIPTTDKQDPILWIEKKSSVTRDDGVSRWDSGAIFASLIKESGSAYATALTGAVKYDGGSGDAIAVHGRVQVSAERGQSFAGWFMNAAYAANQNRVVGIECDARSYLDPLEWRGAGGSGQYTVINVTSGGGTYGVHEYIRIPGKPSGSQQRAWTGILFGQNTIQPTDANGNGEAIRIRGSSSVNERYGGITIGDADAANHYMTYGFKTLNANFTSNNAVQLALGHRIVWGESLGSGTGRWIEMLSSENLFNVQNSSLAMNGVRVLIGRQTGIFQLTGTADGTTKNTETVTLQELARYVKKVTDALITHGMIGPA